MKKSKVYKIIINGKEKFLTGKTVSYEEIVDLIDYKGASLLTVTFRHYESSFGVGGSLTLGQSTKIYEGMIINAVDTSNA